MEIFYLSSTSIPSQKANSLQIMKMCNAFINNGHKVKLFAKKGTEETKNIFGYYGVNKEWPIEFSWFPKIKGFGAVLYSFFVSRKIKTGKKPDLFYGRGLKCMYWLVSLDVPIICELHMVPRNIINYYVTKKVFKSKNLEKVVVTAPSIKKEILRIFPWFDENKIKVVFNGADDLYQKNRNKKEGFDLAYIGSLSSGKGMEIIKDLVNLFPEFSFHIIGGGEKEIEFWKNKIKSNNIKFYGHIPHGEIKRYYKNFDVLLAPYQGEFFKIDKQSSIERWPSPLKIIEYMATGKPIVASKLSMVEEILKNKENALLCSSLEEWKQSISLLYRDEKLRTNLGQRAYSNFLNNYDWNNRAKKVLTK